MLDDPRNSCRTGETYGIEFGQLPYLVLPHSRRPAQSRHNDTATSSILSRRHRHIIKLRNHEFGLQNFGYKFRLRSTPKVIIPGNFITLAARSRDLAILAIFFCFFLKRAQENESDIYLQRQNRISFKPLQITSESLQITLIHFKSGTKQIRVGNSTFET